MPSYNKNSETSSPYLFPLAAFLSASTGKFNLPVEEEHTQPHLAETKEWPRLTFTLNHSKIIL